MSDEFKIEIVNPEKSFLIKEDVLEVIVPSCDMVSFCFMYLISEPSSNAIISKAIFSLQSCL